MVTATCADTGGGDAWDGTITSYNGVSKVIEVAWHSQSEVGTAAGTRYTLSRSACLASNSSAAPWTSSTCERVNHAAASNGGAIVTDGTQNGFPGEAAIDGLALAGIHGDGWAYGGGASRASPKSVVSIFRSQALIDTVKVLSHFGSDLVLTAGAVWYTIDAAPSLGGTWLPLSGLHWLVEVSGGTISGNEVGMAGQAEVVVGFEPALATGFRLDVFDTAFENKNMVLTELLVLGDDCLVVCDGVSYVHDPADCPDHCFWRPYDHVGPASMAGALTLATVAEVDKRCVAPVTEAECAAAATAAGLSLGGDPYSFVGAYAVGGCYAPFDGERSTGSAFWSSGSAEPGQHSHPPALRVCRDGVIWNDDLVGWGIKVNPETATPFDCSGHRHALSANPRAAVCARHPCTADDCCTQAMGTCADTNGGLAGADAYDCTGLANSLHATPSSVVCSAPAVESCTAKMEDASYRNKLFLNDGSGNFTSVDAGDATALTDVGNSWNAVAGDFDSDGRLDLYICNKNKRNRLLLNDGSGGFRDVRVAAPTPCATDADCAAGFHCDASTPGTCSGNWCVPLFFHVSSVAVC